MILKRQLGLPTAVFVVVASMIGTGIFITTGTVLQMTHDTGILLILWVIGGIVALTGSLCYAELATIWPEVGGEYLYLKNTFGLLPAFLTGWISLVVGFSASVAISSISLVKYLSQFAQNLFPDYPQYTGLLTGVWSEKIIAASVILIFAAIHIHGVKTGSKIQNFLTCFKLLIVISLICAGIYLIDWSLGDRLNTFYPWGKGEQPAGIPSYGLALLIIMFSYSGWNGASYIAGEIHNPHKNLPKALFIGTLITACLYICLNVVYLMSAPGSEVMGKEAVGAFTATKLFGTGISSFFTLSICVILLSSVSVQMMIGPRVTYAMATDKMIFAKLARISPRFHSPAFAITVQMAIAIFYIFIGTASSLMEYMGFALSVFPLLAVIGVIYLRIKRPEIERPFKVPFYPLLPLIFIVLTIGMMIAGFLAWTSTSKFAVIVILAGIPVYYLWNKIIMKK